MRSPATRAERSASQWRPALRRSRARLTASADRERRRLERDLHDGAQQQLLAATVQLPLVKELITEGRVEEATTLVERTDERVRGAIEDLRHLARGLCPRCWRYGV